jgi:hypothetical protein
MLRSLTELTPAELAAYRRRLNTPPKIQQFLDDIPYNTEAEGETFRSPRLVLRDRTANCIEGAILAAAALRVQGKPPLIMDLTAVRDEDHVIAVFRRYGLWGAIGTSKFTGLRCTAHSGSWQCRTSSTTSTWPANEPSAVTAVQ